MPSERSVYTPPPVESSVSNLRILVIDEEEAVALAFQRSLTREGLDVEVQTDARTGREAAMSGRFDVVLLDLNLSMVDSFELLREIRASSAPAEVVVTTGIPTVDSAVEAMQLGAADYLTKPFMWTDLQLTLEKASHRSALLRENALLRRELEAERDFEGILGESQQMRRIFSIIKRVAPTDGTVLITGESGTGKEMIARALHRLSNRKDYPLLPCDCSALAPTLLESELFGHVKGSFSGADSTREGLFEAANHGTLFLDEVANLTWETQGKLLRVLESRRVRKVGGTTEHPIELRLVAATNRSLSSMVSDGDFREDLYYRLNVVPIDLPPLRDRHGDIPLLANEFLHRFSLRSGTNIQGFTPEAIRTMEGYSWPGNVRELRNIIERIVILCDSPRVEERHLPTEIASTSSSKREAAPAFSTQLPEVWADFREYKKKVRDDTTRELERRYLTALLQKTGGNVAEASRVADMQRTNLHAMLRRHGVDAKKIREEAADKRSNK